MTLTGPQTWCLRGRGTPADWLFARLLLGTHCSHRVVIQMSGESPAAQALIGSGAATAYSNLIGQRWDWVRETEGNLLHGLTIAVDDGPSHTLGFGRYGASLAGVSFAQLASAVCARAPQTAWQQYSLAAQLHLRGLEVAPTDDPRSIRCTLKPAVLVSGPRWVKRLAAECRAQGAAIGEPSDRADFVVHLSEPQSSSSVSEGRKPGLDAIRVPPQDGVGSTFEGEFALRSEAGSLSLPFDQIARSWWIHTDTDCAAAAAMTFSKLGVARHDGHHWRQMCLKQLERTLGGLDRAESLLRAAAAKGSGAPPPGPAALQLELLLRGRLELPGISEEDLESLTLYALTLAGPPAHPDPLADAIPIQFVTRHLEQIEGAIQRALGAPKLS